MDKKVPLWQIFLVFAKIGAFTIGGGYAMIPIIQDEMSRKKWIPDSGSIVGRVAFSWSF